ALLPLPKQVWLAFLDGLQSGELYENVIVSLFRNTTALIVGGVIGAGLGLLLGLNVWLDRFFSPTLNAIKHVAVFAWIPLMIMWFGHGELSKVIFIALVVFYPVFFNTYDGVKNVPNKIKEVAQIFQLSPVSTFFKVILPAAAPSIFAGLNIALVFSWVATVGAEYFFVSAVGVVNPILDGQNLFKMEVVLYGMAMIAVVGLLFSKAAQFFENYNLRWRQAVNKKT
ncbi:MAG: ABC transporter permease, partial [Acinetobacter sp.]|nr:ABC transporter permease [Acinetobacter sp.]